MGDNHDGTYEKLRPRLGDSLTDNAESTEDTTPEQGSSATKVVVQRVRKPCSDQEGSNVRSKARLDHCARSRGYEVGLTQR